MVEANYFLRAQGNHGVGAALIVTELNLGHGGGKQFDDGSNLTAYKPLFGHILEHGDFGKKFHQPIPPSS
jgi:hypothetical protein